jgi:hypothetical protein
MDNLILYTHVGFLLMATVGIIMADSSAFAWVRGKKEMVDEHAFFYPHWLVTIGLVGLIATGCYLFWPMRDYLLAQPYFLAKMAFVFALTINAFFIEKIMHRAARQSFSSLGFKGQLPYLISGAVSTASWVAVVVLAFAQFGLDALFA